MPTARGPRGLCAGVLARAHACSGDAAQIAGYLGRGDQFDSAMARFAESYADHVEEDHQALRRHRREREPRSRTIQDLQFFNRIDSRTASATTSSLRESRDHR